ncbi:MAG: hypothetical protein ABIG43_03775, partial [Chloroflexota bacterium]
CLPACINMFILQNQDMLLFCWVNELLVTEGLEERLNNFIACSRYFRTAESEVIKVEMHKNSIRGCIISKQPLNEYLHAGIKHDKILLQR